MKTVWKTWKPFIRFQSCVFQDPYLRYLEVVIGPQWSGTQLREITVEDAPARPVQEFSLVSSVASPGKVDISPLDPDGLL